MEIICQSDAGCHQKTRCSGCCQFNDCLWDNMAKEWLPSLEMLISHRRPLRRGQHMVMAGDESEGLCLVRSGCLKTYTIDKDGEMQITGFYFPGELLCIDDMATGIYPYNVEALDVSSVYYFHSCYFAYSKVLSCSNAENPEKNQPNNVP